MSETIVLAFSGGLDTCFCLHHLVKQGHQVHTVFIDTGGVSEQEKQQIAERAAQLGAIKHHLLDASQALWDDFVKPLIWSKGRMRGDYPLLCSDRYLIVALCLGLCDQLETKHFAHGCTAMGNDQFRFDHTVHALGDYQIWAPIRDLQDQVEGNLRDHELAVLADAGMTLSASHQDYSINENLLGVTISGSEIDQYQAPSEAAALWVKPHTEWPNTPFHCQLTFEHGVATHLNGETISGPELLQQLNQKLGAYGVGKHIYTGDVTVGIKGRIVFECPGIDALMVAHKALEDVVNSKHQNQFRDTIADRWTEMLYQGFYFDPHKKDLEAYLAQSQSHVSGTVTLTTTGGQLLATAVDTPWLIHDPSAVYAQNSSWSAEQAVGFIKLYGQSTQMVNQVRRSQ